MGKNQLKRLNTIKALQEQARTAKTSESFRKAKRDLRWELKLYRAYLANVLDMGEIDIFNHIEEIL